MECIVAGIKKINETGGIGAENSATLRIGVATIPVF
jgi:hypothetical protein